MLSHVLGAVDKTSSSFSAHSKIGNFIIIIIIQYKSCLPEVSRLLKIVSLAMLFKESTDSAFLMYSEVSE